MLLQQRQKWLEIDRVAAHESGGDADGEGLCCAIELPGSAGEPAAAEEQVPRLLGVNPDLLLDRKAFTFAATAKGYDISKTWSLLRNPQSAARNPQ